MRGGKGEGGASVCGGGTRASAKRVSSCRRSMLSRWRSMLRRWRGLLVLSTLLSMLMLLLNERTWKMEMQEGGESCARGGERPA